ncbi:restriction endonuclease subunit S [Vibrio cholerae]|uniref:restriction endonuclease subunit S n=1 Tax=Vibrio cholerae TaxID=666 RepID=UPI0011DA3341|nr:restriction endonuclease subunit S [Vibrio cholerae]TXY03355.1 restriction endonuclease subunit S [Vibrio cholerae]GIA88960.1 restriction endonuclease subunit S [Vibrio cholerae]
MTVKQIAESNPIYLLGSSTSIAPAGYKQTELGIIPEDWFVSPIGQRHILATGTTPPTANAANYGDRYLFVSPADLGEAKYVLKTEKRLSEKGFKLARQYPSGSTLFTCIGSTIGKTGLSREILTSNQQINAIFPSNDSDPEFVYYAVTHIAPRVKALAGQQAVPLVNKSEFGETLYCYPSSKTEQTAIANALSDVDALIQELEKLIAKKQAIKTATMQQLLTGRTRLPQFAHHPDGRKKGYKPSELGEIPEDWEVMSIGTIADVKTGPFGSALHEKDYVQSGTPIITVEHLGEMGITYQNLPLVSESDKARLRAYKLSEGDIVFSRVGSIDRNALVKGNEDGWLFSGRLLRIKLKSQKNIPSYLSFYFHTLPFKRRVVEVAVGQTMPSLNTTILKNLLVVLPELKLEQAAISEFLSHIDEEIQAIEQRLNKTRQIKQGMMQELLTGKTRLVKPAGAA